MENSSPLLDTTQIGIGERQLDASMDGLRSTSTDEDCRCCNQPVQNDARHPYCEECEGWFHLWCVGITEEQLPPDDVDYVCPACGRNEESMVQSITTNEESRSQYETQTSNGISVATEITALVDTAPSESVLSGPVQTAEITNLINRVLELECNNAQLIEKIEQNSDTIEQLNHINIQLQGRGQLIEQLDDKILKIEDLSVKQRELNGMKCRQEELEKENQDLKTIVLELSAKIKALEEVFTHHDPRVEEKLLTQDDQNSKAIPVTESQCKGK